jgi:nicotinamide-nucleotide amidase
LTETQLDDILKPIHLPRSGRLSFRAHYPELTLCLTLRGGEENREKLQEIEAKIHKLLRPYVYSEGDETLEEIVGSLLREKGWTLALAESCTGGYLSHRMTRVAGASDYFKAGAVVYSNEAKIRFLGVKETTLEQHGAVSCETAIEMAEGIRRQASANIALSVTGVAGPTGGCSKTPVGTVWIGVAHLHGGEARRFRFHGDREHVIQGASQAALHWLRTTLLSNG